MFCEQKLGTCIPKYLNSIKFGNLSKGTQLKNVHINWIKYYKSYVSLKSLKHEFHNSDIFRANILVSVLPLCYQNVLKYTISNTNRYFKNIWLFLGKTSKSWIFTFSFIGRFYNLEQAPTKFLNDHTFLYYWRHFHPFWLLSLG